jgi:hypothetical protein
MALLCTISAIDKNQQEDVHFWMTGCEVVHTKRIQGESHDDIRALQHLIEQWLAPAEVCGCRTAR